MIDTQPWSPYLLRASLPSAGRRTLIAAFADFIKVCCDFEHHELQHIFYLPADDGENDACREIVRSTAEFMMEQFVRGKIATFARPLEGGIITQLNASIWEIDDPLTRFATGAFNLENWAISNAELTHRLFVDSVAFDQWLMLQEPFGLLSSSEIEAALDPRVRAGRSLAATDNLRTHDQISFEERPALAASVYCFAAKSDTIALAEVMRRTSLKRSTIYFYMAKGKFPQNFPLTDNRVGWSSEEIDRWIGERAANRDR